MRIHRRRGRGQVVKKAIVQEYDANTQIKAERLFVITETGAPLGEMSRAEALKAAEERELDLVVVSPKANPPVARIIDHGQFRYEKEKLARKQKAQSRQTDTKAIRLSVRIGSHDMDVRMKRAMEFFDRGDKVKLEIILRGREKAFTDRGRSVMELFVNRLKTEHGLDIALEQEFKKAGSRLSMVLGKK